MADLTPRQARFVDEYLIDLNATQAAIRAGYSAKTALQQGPRLLGNVGVAEAIAAAQAKRAERTRVEADWVLRQWVEIASADPRELVQYLRGACPDCWDGAEYDAEKPDPNCRKCAGRGKGHVVLADTRHLSESAARLYAGVQLGRDGIKVNMRSQDGALENVARHLGMFKDRLELSGALALHETMDPDKAAAVLAEGLRTLEAKRSRQG